jgi:hypothetical protein
MSSKHKSPKMEEDILLQTVQQMVNTKNKNVSKSLEKKTPKQKKIKNDFLHKIEDMLFSNTNSKSITENVEIMMNKHNYKQQETEIKQPKIIRKTKRIGGNIIQITEEIYDDEEIIKGGYGKNFINNHVRLYDGDYLNQHFVHQI